MIYSTEHLVIFAEMCHYYHLMPPFGEAELFFRSVNQNETADFVHEYQKHLTVATITCFNRCEIELNDGGEMNNSKVCRNGTWFGKWPKCKCPKSGRLGFYEHLFPNFRDFFNVQFIFR